MHICRTEAQTSAENFGGGGEAGTPAHQYGFRGAAAVGAAVGCRALALGTTRAAPIARKNAIAEAFIEFIFPPLRLTNRMLTYQIG